MKEKENRICIAEFVVGDDAGYPYRYLPKKQRWKGKQRQKI